VTVTLTPRTHVFWWGKGTLAGPAVGDLVRAFGKQCGDTFTASLVQASPARQAADGPEARGAKEGSDAHTQATEGKSRLHK
jgi:hypothetical protein